MEYKESDFRSLKYNIYSLSKLTNPLDHFPEMNRYKEYKENVLPLSKVLVLRYIIFLYSKGTPLSKELDLTKRKFTALELAGFEKENGNYSQDILNMIERKVDEVNRMIVRFVRNQNDLRFAALMALNEAYYTMILQISSNEIFNKDEDALKDSDTKQKMSKGLLGMIKDMESLTHEVFNNDTELLQVADEVIQEENGIISYPELFAEKIKNGEV
jgi:hypothetical protein